VVALTEGIMRFRVLRADYTVSAQLTPAQKVCRHHVMDKCAADIDAAGRARRSVRVDDLDRAGRVMQQRLRHRAEDHPVKASAAAAACHDHLRAACGAQRRRPRRPATTCRTTVTTGCSFSWRVIS
jgi:hypothetical protein